MYMAEAIARDEGVGEDAYIDCMKVYESYRVVNANLISAPLNDQIHMLSTSARNSIMMTPRID